MKFQELLSMVAKAVGQSKDAPKIAQALEDYAARRPLGYKRLLMVPKLGEFLLDLEEQVDARIQH